VESSVPWRKNKPFLYLEPWGYWKSSGPPQLIIFGLKLIAEKKRKINNDTNMIYSSILQPLYELTNTYKMCAPHKPERTLSIQHPCLGTLSRGPRLPALLHKSHICNPIESSLCNKLPIFYSQRQSWITVYKTSNQHKLHTKVLHIPDGQDGFVEIQPRHLDYGSKGWKWNSHASVAQ
jgi:hypothetical protein